MATIALIDGLAIQHALDPDGVDTSLATRLWEVLLKTELAGVRSSASIDSAG
jgi:hypothetical protein